MQQDELKQAAALAALAYIELDMVLGIGSGTTVHFFIEALKKVKGKIDSVVASSEDTAQRLKAIGLHVVELNSVSDLACYIDGTDEVNGFKQLIKGGGAALTREKIIATAAKKFVCLADETKRVDVLGQFPVAVEVIPMARSFVAREIVKLGADPVYRQHVVTDNGNIILDVHNLKLLHPLEWEQKLNNIPGVIANGIFAARTADVVLLSTQQGVQTF